MAAKKVPTRKQPTPPNPNARIAKKIDRKPASAGDFRKADQASIAKGPLTPSEKKNYASMHNAIAEMGMKVGGAAEDRYIRMYYKYNKPEAKLTGAMLSSLKKDYAALAGKPAKKIVRKTITPDVATTTARARIRINNAKKK